MEEGRGHTHSTRSNYISTTIQRLASGAFEGLCVNDNSVAWAGASGVTEKGNEEREGEEGKKKKVKRERDVHRLVTTHQTFSIKKTYGTLAWLSFDLVQRNGKEKGRSQGHRRGLVFGMGGYRSRIEGLDGDECGKMRKKGKNMSVTPCIRRLERIPVVEFATFEFQT